MDAPRSEAGSSPLRGSASSPFLLVPALLLTVLGVVWLVHPWGSGAFDDDWAYTSVTRHLAATGAFEVNGWVSPLLGLQALVGAAAIRALGDSPDILRWTTIAWLLVGVVAAHGVARRAGATPWLAAFAAACIGLSPFAIPLSVTFMSDVPAMSGLLVCVALAASAWDRSALGDRKRALLLLAAAAAAGFAAGTIRQVVWSVPLTVVALFALDHRRDRRIVVVAGTIGVALALAAWRTSHWFQSLPLALAYGQGDSGPPAIVARPLDVAARGVEGLLTLIVVCAPATWALVPRLRPRWDRVHRGRAAVVLVVGAAAVAACPTLLLPPWLPNTLTASGVLGVGTCVGSRPDLLPHWIRATVMLLAAAPVVLWLLRSRAPSQDVPPAAAPGRRALVSALVGLSLATVLHLSLSGLFFDRYLMPVAALATIALLTHRTAGQGRRPSPAGAAALVVLCAYGVVTAHDYFELLRVRRQALESVIATGVDRSRVCAGYELDGPFQLAQAGHVDGGVPSLRVPHEGCPAPSPLKDRYWALRLTTQVQPTHFVVTSPQDWLDPTPVLELRVHAWMPAARHGVWVQKLAHPGD